MASTLKLSGVSAKNPCHAGWRPVGIANSRGEQYGSSGLENGPAYESQIGVLQQMNAPSPSSMQCSDYWQPTYLAINVSHRVLSKPVRSASPVTIRRRRSVGTIDGACAMASAGVAGLNLTAAMLMKVKASDRARM